ncbi:hypothetical protein [Rhizorhabdus wittichii]|uniref:hypothetical protein n=1 Tax=Rhizorhabdus wittichii TaxID=160791 RepID=UPI0012FD2C19|nr:hypothetical protein [Rhizorhabdus wittichii]
MRVRERDLRHDADPVRFGAAMTVCEGYAPECSYNGRCMWEGRCFASPPNLVAARMIEKLLPADGRAGMHYAYLQRVAEMLREDQVVL